MVRDRPVPRRPGPDARGRSQGRPRSSPGSGRHGVVRRGSGRRLVLVCGAPGGQRPHHRWRRYGHRRQLGLLLHVATPDEHDQLGGPAGDRRGEAGLRHDGSGARDSGSSRGGATPAVFARDPVRTRGFRLRRREGPGRHRRDDPEGRDCCARRRVGLRQDHDRKPPAALLRPHRRPHSVRRPRDPFGHARILAQADRPRHARDDALRRHGQEQHRLRAVGRSDGEDRCGGQIRARARVHRKPPRQVRHDRGRERLAPVRGAAAARDHRARAPQGPADSRSRRGDLRARFGIRKARSGGARSPHEEPDQPRHRAPPLDGATRRPDPRPGKGQVVETGTHRELLDQNGIYARFHALQMQDD